MEDRKNTDLFSILNGRFGRKRGVIVPMLLAAVGAAGSVLLTTDDESKKGNRNVLCIQQLPNIFFSLKIPIEL